MANDRARALRKAATDAETHLWARLRNRQLKGRKFRRQVPIGPYIAGFVCLEDSLVVELDGGQHARRSSADDERTAWLQAEGYRVVRFWNHDVLQNTEGVLQAIQAALRPRN